ncbi:hypothetical protein HPB51_028920 [Rhipicephalus microplus]|uniref:Uncharacterized protein n=1 Tax=Rhipicephalus microplus TaxID=6941 RepID=A0A9J6CW58_RHIMP|nr:hypothetical protein HPB51_028920 [Rhipicephalus microplus]
MLATRLNSLIPSIAAHTVMVHGEAGHLDSKQNNQCQEDVPPETLVSSMSSTLVGPSRSFGDMRLADHKYAFKPDSPVGAPSTSVAGMECFVMMASAKHLPKGYKYCRNVLKLPSVRSLQLWLQRVPLRVWICPDIFDLVKRSGLLLANVPDDLSLDSASGLHENNMVFFVGWVANKFLQSHKCAGTSQKCKLILKMHIFLMKRKYSFT